MVKNPPYNAGDSGSIPDQGPKIPHAVGQLSPRATTTEPASLSERALMPQTTEPTRPGALAPQLEKTVCRKEESTRTPQRKIPHASMKIPCATTKTRRSQKIKNVFNLKIFFNLNNFFN